MKKKLTLGITIVALATMAIVGGTLAWFTSSDSVTNILKTGKIAVEVTEPSFDKTDGVADSTVSQIVPGAVITKDPTINNTGDDAQIRYMVTVDLKDKKGNSMNLPVGEDKDALVFTNSVAGFKINDWVELGVVKKGADTIKLFDSVAIPQTWGNAYQEATLTINVQVQAAQVDNFTSADWAKADFTTSLTD